MGNCKLKNYCYVFARGGSKGIPKKNIKFLIDKPLIAYSLLIASEIKSIDKFFVSTDCQEIKDVALEYGAEIIDRPLELAQDESPEWLAWQHAIDWTINKYGDFSKFISLPATAPLRSKNDIETCINALDSSTDIVVTITNAYRNPFFNMVKIDDGYLKLVNEQNDKIYRRQDAPLVFDMTTIAYISKPKFILNNNSIWSGRVKGVPIPKERAIDIDDYYDFEIAEFLLKKRGSKND